MKKALVASLLTLAVISVSPVAASADPVDGGTASAFGLTASLAGTELIPPTPEATVTAPPFEDVNETTVPIPADPLAVSGTLIANAAVHQSADLPSALEQSSQAVAGPYNARAVGQVEDLEVLVDAIETGVPLLEADLLRAEAVAVCSAGTVEYSASSEVVNLVIGGEDPLSGPLNDLLNQILEAIEPLAPVLDADTNVVTETEDGIAVDALVVTVLSAADPESPVVELRVGHAEVSGAACGDIPECSDGADNDGDGRADADDPGCYTDPGDPDTYDPDDDDEGDEPQCVDTIDNEGDGVADAEDPGCHTDGDATNPDSYDPSDDDETNVLSGGALPNQNTESTGGALPRTGSPIATGMAAVLGIGALGLLALRRRAV